MRWIAALVLFGIQILTLDRSLSLIEAKWVVLFSPLVAILYIVLLGGVRDVIREPIFILLMSLFGYVSATQQDLRGGFDTGFSGTLLIYIYLADRRRKREDGDRNRY